MITPEQIESAGIYTQMGMTSEEFDRVKQILGRLPNYTELGLFSVMWSEHCSYKNTKSVLRKFPTSGKQVLQGPGEGAGVVDIGDGLAAVFKLESHNYPSAVVPFDGAATGVGGIIRDVFSMGARPVAVLNSLRFGELDNERTRYLLEECVAGMANYGNGMEIPTLAGEIQFDNCYETNPLVNAMCVGLIKHDGIKKGIASGVGNAVMYLGAKTGLDGVHGATYASAELSEEDEPDGRPTVPAGDPILQKRLMEACLELMDNPSLVGIQDMGAAGLTSSSSEMAAKGGVGIEIDLDKVPLQKPNITPYEMMLSETQERMLLVIKHDKQQEIIDICAKHNITVVTIGKVTDDGQMRLLYKGEICAQVPAQALADAPEYNKPSQEAAYYQVLKAKDATINGILAVGQQNVTADGTLDYEKTLYDLLATPTIASKHWVFNQFDKNEDTIVPPGSDSGVLRVPGTQKALAMTVDCNSRYVYLDPFIGGKIAVAEAARNIVASGATPLAVTDNLNFGSPENPEIFWQLEQSAAGISEACIALDTPVIGGNVSLYNERGDSAIYPTPTIGMVGLIESISHITTQDFKAEKEAIYLLGETHHEFGGSELQKMLSKGEIYGAPPAIDLAKEKRLQDVVLCAIRQGLLSSAHDVSEGGIAVCLAECLMCTEGLGCTGGFLGADIKFADDDVAAFLFSESQSRFIVSCSVTNQAALEKLTCATLLGYTTKSGQLSININGNEIINTPVAKLSKSWRGALEKCLLK